jgi:uncharacterized Zn-binding protein involved in type VI secretion
MPGPICHAGNVTMCPHGGSVQGIPSTPRVLVSGMPAVALGDTFPIAGCAFTIPGVGPHPCIMAQWVTPAVRVFIMGRPAITQASVGLCMAPDGAPQGPPVVSVNQPRVIAL